MTIEEISFRDFIRGEIPADILQLLDKRTHTSKGIFVSSKYADDVLTYLQEKEKQRKENRKKALLDFVGAFGEGDDTSHQALKAGKYE